MSGVKSISCPNCGGIVELRGMAHSLTAVCIQCLSVIDAASPQVKMLQQFQESARAQPKIPLGARGKLEGHVWEALGFQVRAIYVEGVQYTWDEYLLFNPYQGFRYLSDYNGHWNFIRPARGLPLVNGTKLRYQGASYRHFQASKATTVFAMGEFPWKVRANDEVEVNDFVTPPYLLSCEKTDGEVTWSYGIYRTGAEIAKGFGLTQPLPAASGIFANQPNPHEMGSIWFTCLWLTVLLFATMMAFGLLSGGDRVYSQSFSYAGPGVDDAVTTPQFEIGGKTSNVEISTRANLENDWIYLNLALVNASTEAAYTAGRELEREGAGAATDAVTFAQVPPGRYYLRIEPEMSKTSPMLRYHAVHYDIEVRRDVPHYMLFWLAVPLLLLPAVWRSIQRSAFETTRWQESDYAS